MGSDLLNFFFKCNDTEKKREKNLGKLSMCNCLEKKCDINKHIEHCYCAIYKTGCCLELGCKSAIYNSGHVEACSKYKKCLCLEANCNHNKKKHNKPCKCDDKCECTVYHCKLQSGCCDRKPGQKCRYYSIELCSHCDELRRKAIVFETYDSKKQKKICECKCTCDYECDGYCTQCETHAQNGWNLLNWQKYRHPTFFSQTPQEKPYYFEEPSTGNQRPNVCIMCQKSYSVMKSFSRSCEICFDLVCYNCSGEYIHNHQDVDYDGNCMPYWKFERDSCQGKDFHYQFPD